MISFYFVKVTSDLHITKNIGQFFAFILLDLEYDIAHQPLLSNILSYLTFSIPASQSFPPLCGHYQFQWS